MGIQNYLVSSATVGIIAQRLVRKICLKCKTTHTATLSELKMLGMHEDETLELAVGTGCNSCNHTGYSGRTAIHEVLLVDRDIRNMISSGKQADEIKQKAISKGMTTLSDTCKELVKEGITTLDEMLRMTYNFDE